DGQSSQKGDGQPSQKGDGQSSQKGDGQPSQKTGQEGRQGGQQGEQNTNQSGEGKEQGGKSGSTPKGGGGSEGSGNPRPEDAKDDGTPSPTAKEPEDQSGDTVAPQNQDQSEMVLRTVKDLLAKDAVTPDIEAATGMSKSEMQQFVKKYERGKSAPAGPGREIDIKPGDSTKDATPSANLPDLGGHKFSSKNVTDRGSRGRDDARGMSEGIRFAAPAEFRGRVEGYKNALSRSRINAAGKAAKPAAAPATPTPTPAGK
ncbi:MAG: hypothetical protein P4L85_24670, partial [Paludisphaera borealis]